MSVGKDVIDICCKTKESVIEGLQAYTQAIAELKQMIKFDMVVKQSIVRIGLFIIGYCIGCHM